MRRGGMGGLIQGGMCLILWPRGHVFDVIAKGAYVWCCSQGGGHLFGGGGGCFLESEHLFDEIQYILAWDLSLQSTGVTGAKIYSKFIRVRHSLDDKI